MMYEFKVKSDIYRDGVEGESKLIKKNVKSKMVFDTVDIRIVSEVVGISGKILKNSCEIWHKDYGKIILNHPYDYIKNLKDGMVMKGYK